MSKLTQRLVYSVVGDAPSRNITFEWVASHYADLAQHYWFQVSLYEDKPNEAIFTYLDISDGGGSATVGVQREEGKLSELESFFRFGLFSPPLACHICATWLTCGVCFSSCFADGLFTQYTSGGSDLPAIWPGLVLTYDVETNGFVPSSLDAGRC